ncbi:MAG TPA: glucans biosynthesis glucosyltransferase MdoH [Rhodospirillales bacterium]|nr:glucans biosynthesis glucosyltransferase MdoH [Rhodospirillales bacterium]
MPRQRFRPLFDRRRLRAWLRRSRRGRVAAGRRDLGWRSRRLLGGRRRLSLALLVFATFGWMTAGFARLLAADGLTLPEFLHIGVFALLALWLSQSFWVLSAGFLLLWRRRRALAPASPAPAPTGPRVALVMPVYNEDTERVFAGIAAMWSQLARHPVFARCDFFILSDTTSSDLWLREVDSWHRLRRDLPGGGRIFYRRRLENRGRKTGNIEDFLLRWGYDYEYFLVLDADSLMSARTVAALVARMDADPGLGLLQVPPRLARGRTLFARLLQFAGELYGPLAAAGTAFWAMDSGNYWGHNAILRTRPFMAHCGLPELPGRAPLGGPILSHDFVEAALMRRAGYAVRIAWDLDGSYEEPPPTLEQFLRRDRRWCQGNLQHARVLLARGLRPASRLHLLIGIMSYLTSPLWLLFLLLAVIRAWPLAPLAEFAMRSPWDALTALLPASAGSAVLLATTFLLLLLPKLFGLWLAFADAARRQRLGGGPRLLAGFLLENLFAALLAPVTMLFHSLFVVSILGGAAVDWKPQRRVVSSGTAAALRRMFLWPSLLGSALLALAFGLDVRLGLWLSPVLAGVALALPLAFLTASERLGERLRRAGLLLVAEETAPTPVVAEAEARLVHRYARPLAEDLFARTLLEPARFALHLGLLAIGGGARGCEGDRLQALARKAVALGPARLDQEERRLVLEMPALLVRLHGELRARWFPPAAEDNAERACGWERARLIAAG